VTAADRFERWLLAPASATRLAALRIAVGAYALVWLAAVTPELLGLADLDPARFEPVGGVAWLRLPAPSSAGMVLLLLATGAAGVASTAGWRYRSSAPLFAVGLLVVTSYQNSWGKLLHTENLLVLHVTTGRPPQRRQGRDEHHDRHRPRSPPARPPTRWPGTLGATARPGRPTAGRCG
jgi:hypothetical protein